MKGCVVAVETGAALRRAALIRDGSLEALEIDRLGENHAQAGAIYRCRITGIIAGLSAATADLGGGESGFLPEVADLSPGDSLLVEIRREAEEGKAARLSPIIQLRSPHLVFTPQRPGINVSRKIADEAERLRLRGALDAVKHRGGFVIRTQAQGIAGAVLAEEAAGLVARYDALAADPTPGLRAPAPDAVARVLAKAKGVEAILADEESRDGLATTLPVRADPAPFETLDLDDVITRLCSARHDLAEGWLSIDPTPALVAIDVNTGAAARGKAALRVNLDAAQALPRVLALKKTGGLLMVDFAGAPRGEDRKKIAAAFERAAGRYLDGVTVYGWGPAGLFEALCRRPGRSLAQLLAKDSR